MNWTTKNTSIGKLFLLSIIGVVSILYSDFPVLEKFDVPKWTILIQPLILSILFVFLGLYSLHKTNFPFHFKNDKELLEITLKKVVIGFITAFILGTLLFFITPHFENLLPNFLKEFDISIITKFLYGGINEEIIIRLGLLSFLFYIFKKFFKNDRSRILALLVSSLLFAIGHLPILYVEGPPDFKPVLFVIIANFLYGIIFGYLYIKYNLTTSMICHAFTHLFHFVLT